MRAFFVTVCFAAAVLIFGNMIYKYVVFEQNCGGYLKRAADANTIETAKAELDKSIKYLEENGMTKGYTSIFYRTPDEDIEFFYNNLKASSVELSKVDSTTTSLEKTNILMKLRETLLDDGEKGTTVTCPDGLSKYPSNTMYFYLGLLGIALLIMGVIGIIVASEY